MSVAAPSLDLSRLDQIELPTTDQEIWRYSRIGDLDLARFAPADHELDIRNGDGYVADDGVVALFDGPPDVFAEISAARGQAVHLSIPAGTVVPEPIVVTQYG